MEEDLLKIIEHYGVIPQLKYFQSEIWELNEAIIRYEFAKEDNIDCSALDGLEKWDIDYFKKCITEEISDCLVMINQFIEYYRIQESDIYITMEQKIDRQLERIKNETVAKDE